MFYFKKIEGISGEALKDLLLCFWKSQTAPLKWALHFRPHFRGWCLFLGGRLKLAKNNNRFSLSGASPHTTKFLKLKKLKKIVFKNCEFCLILGAHFKGARFFCAYFSKDARKSARIPRALRYPLNMGFPAKFYFYFKVSKQFLFWRPF